jgi:hypothetical protein
MIRYNKIIELSSRNNQLQLKTDRGQTWETSLVKGTTTPWSDWWSKQHPSEFRRNQKDYFLELLARAFIEKHYTNTINLYVVYERGNGYNQQHDIALAHIPNANIWLLSTSDHTWIEESKLNNFKFDICTAMGSIETKGTKDIVWDLYDAFRKAYA